MPQPVIIDGVSHAYQLNPENFRGRYGQIFADVMWSFHPVCSLVRGARVLAEAREKYGEVLAPAQLRTAVSRMDPP